MARYYKVDIRRLPVTLMWQWGNRAALLLFAIRKFLPVPWFGPVLVPAEPVAERVPEGEADERLLQAVAPASAYFTESGFRSVTCYSVPTLGTGRALARALLSRDGKVIALCLVSRSGPFQDAPVSLISQGMDGQIIGTGSAVRRLPREI